MNSPSHQDFKNFLTEKAWGQLKKGHPWILESHLKKNFPRPSQPSLAHLGEHWFAVSPTGNIVLRRIGSGVRNWATGAESNFAEDFFTTNPTDKRLELFWLKLAELIQEKLIYKKSLNPQDTCFRWIFSESDLIPGLVVDVFSKDIIVQIQTAVAEAFWPQFKSLLEKCWIQIFGAQEKRNWIELRHHRFRKSEGLEIIDPVENQVVESVENWMGLKWLMSPAGGQKTGAYLDQGENHKKCAAWAERLSLRSAWDLFCFEGGFGIHLLKNSLTSVHFVDASKEALQKVKKNCDLNNIDPNRYSYGESDVFSFLRGEFRTLNETFQNPDLIILDPPSLSKTMAHRNNALNAFRDLNLQALKIIKSGGMLISCSCSQTISKNDYLEMLRIAAHAARKSLQVLEASGPSPDHAPAVEFPEGDYLQTWYLKVI